MIDFMQWIGTIGGIGGVFAVLLFFVYRQTTKQMREDRKYAEDRLTNLIKENFQIRERDIQSTNENTKVLTELFTWLRIKNGGKS